MDISLLDEGTKVEIINDMRARSGQIGEVYMRKIDVSYTVKFGDDELTEEFHSEELKEVDDDST